MFSRTSGVRLTTSRIETSLIIIGRGVADGGTGDGVSVALVGVGIGVFVAVGGRGVGVWLGVRLGTGLSKAGKGGRVEASVGNS